jgi:hypothetical protein
MKAFVDGARRSEQAQLKTKPALGGKLEPKKKLFTIIESTGGVLSPGFPASHVLFSVRRANSLSMSITLS